MSTSPTKNPHPRFQISKISPISESGILSRKTDQLIKDVLEIKSENISQFQQLLSSIAAANGDSTEIDLSAVKSTFYNDIDTLIERITQQNQIVANDFDAISARAQHLSLLESVLQNIRTASDIESLSNSIQSNQVSVIRMEIWRQVTTYCIQMGYFDTAKLLISNGDKSLIPVSLYSKIMSILPLALYPQKECAKHLGMSTMNEIHLSEENYEKLLDTTKLAAWANSNKIELRKYHRGILSFIISRILLIFHCISTFIKFHSLLNSPNSPNSPNNDEISVYLGNDFQKTLFLVKKLISPHFGARKHAVQHFMGFVSFWFFLLNQKFSSENNNTNNPNSPNSLNPPSSSGTLHRDTEDDTLDNLGIFHFFTTFPPLKNFILLLPYRYQWIFLEDRFKIDFITSLTSFHLDTKPDLISNLQTGSSIQKNKYSKRNFQEKHVSLHSMSFLKSFLKATDAQISFSLPFSHTHSPAIPIKTTESKTFSPIPIPSPISKTHTNTDNDTIKFNISTNLGTLNPNDPSNLPEFSDFLSSVPTIHLSSSHLLCPITHTIISSNNPPMVFPIAVISPTGESTGYPLVSKAAISLLTSSVIVKEAFSQEMGRNASSLTEYRPNSNVYFETSSDRYVDNQEPQEEEEEEAHYSTEINPLEDNLSYPKSADLPESFEPDFMNPGSQHFSLFKRSAFVLEDDEKVIDIVVCPRYDIWCMPEKLEKAYVM